MDEKETAMKLLNGRQRCFELRERKKVCVENKKSIKHEIESIKQELTKARAELKAALTERREARHDKAVVKARERLANLTKKKGE